MNRSFSDISDFIQDNDVKFVKFSFCDVFGRQRIVSVLPSLLPRAMDGGVSVDAANIPGFENTSGVDELYLYPDTSTIALLPWRPSHGRVARFYCGVRNENGVELAQDSRRILRDAVDYAKERGVTVDFDAENDFYLFRTDDSGEPTDLPFDSAGYLDAAPDDRGEDVRRDICLTLEDMGIDPLSSKHLGGPGQNRIDFAPGPALQCADNVITFRSVVQMMAVRNGLWASFDPKPIANQPGNGFRIAMLPKLNGGSCADSFAAGILAHAAEMTAILDPVDGSYERLGKMGAPGEICYSDAGRSSLIRGRKNGRVEISSPDGAANPYLAFALLLYAGVDGVTRGLRPERIPTSPLPRSLADARKICADSEFIRTHLPPEVVYAYTHDSKR